MLDRAARQRRINRQLEALENDNFQDDPHAGLPQLGKRLPQFDDDADTGEEGDEVAHVGTGRTLGGRQVTWELLAVPGSGSWGCEQPLSPAVSASLCVTVKKIHR